ncbi:hypothetical protein [Azospirillum rugosum]|uniref:Uncharacterized protein n=1 Tax=Azospirillum rugosum TaxID=416170 RepID=A0ABS4STM9_9PROT|nr:hypothetical protein [Azospirillum rugosum]MBP2295923.1 hypothetical protein [Azospirillum rugosum]MDQ0530180.1 hypothetical protein [Azospirillum rugosum]
MRRGRETSRRELANLGNALTLAERGRGQPRHSPADLMAWLLRVARLYPAALADSTLLQLCDVISGDFVEDEDKVALIRMSWAAIVQAEYKHRGLMLVEGRSKLPLPSREREGAHALAWEG